MSFHKAKITIEIEEGGQRVEFATMLEITRLMPSPYDPPMIEAERNYFRSTRLPLPPCWQISGKTHGTITIAIP